VADAALATRMDGDGKNVVALLSLEYPESPTLLKALTRYE
jgi:hypothetical protein